MEYTDIDVRSMYIHSHREHNVVIGGNKYNAGALTLIIGLNDTQVINTHYLKPNA